MGIQFVEKYYWLSKLVPGQSGVISDPDKLLKNPETYWLSGIFEWMVPFYGVPAPHNIVYGQWEVTNDLQPGFGAIIARTNSWLDLRGDKGARMTSIYKELLRQFGAPTFENEANEMVT